MTGSLPPNAGRPSGRRVRRALHEANKRIKVLKQENEVLRRVAAYLSQGNLPENDVPARP